MYAHDAGAGHPPPSPSEPVESAGGAGQVGRPPILPSPAASPRADAGLPDDTTVRAIQRFGTIVIVGGGCYGSFYLRQLGRASLAGAVAWRRLLVVDRDPDCLVTRTRLAMGDWPAGVTDAEIVVSEWRSFFSGYLDDAAADPGLAVSDAIVPSPLMPHLMYDWLLDRAVRRWPARHVERQPLGAAPAVPWTRRGDDGTQYVSFAEWMCPINCIEPARCPHTRGPRDWSMPPAIQSFVQSQRDQGRMLHGPCIFHCSHRAYGVGMIDTRDVIDADQIVAAAAGTGAAEILVGTMSHCHGALGVLAIGGVPRS